MTQYENIFGSVSKSFKEHKSHNKVETEVGRREVGAMGDSMEGEKALRLLYHERSPDLTESFVWNPADVHKPQGFSLSIVNTGRAVEDIDR